MASISKYATAHGTRWRVRYRTDDHRSTDKRGFDSRRAAENWAAKTLLDLNAGTFISETARKKQAGPLIEAHINATTGLSAATVAARRSIAHLWVLPDWADRPVGRVRHSDVQAWIARIGSTPREVLRGRGVTMATAGAATIRKAHGILYAALQLAVADRLIPSNPATGVKLPKEVSSPHRYLTHAELLELVDAAPTQDQDLILFLGLTGLRFGEAAALRRRDLMIDARRLRVERAVTEVHGRLIEGLPKNDKRRIVAIPNSLLARLEERASGLGSEDVLFAAPRGGSLRLTTWRRRVFAPTVERVNARRLSAAAAAGTPFDEFPSLTPHDLRHTAASLAVQAGANVNVIQRNLGHASAAITLNVYADLFESDLDDMAIRMDEAHLRAAAAYELDGL